MTRRLRVCFLIRQLNEGGAQRQLLELIRGMDAGRFEVTLVTFYSGGIFEHEAQTMPGLTLVSLRKAGRWDVVPFALRLVGSLRAARPDIVHGYLTTANLLAVLVAPLLPRARVVWGIRSGNMDLTRYDRLTRFQARIELALARGADLIVLNSNAARDYHVARGFPPSKCVVVPNGFDLRRFVRDRTKGTRLRAEWGVGESALLIGTVARLDPMKGLATFLDAAATIRRDRPDARFVCVGSGPPAYAAELAARTEELGLSAVVKWAGSHDDMVAVYSALDVMSLCSVYGEGFPNVVAEAMACGVPCVVTDVGDAADVVGDLGRVVPPGDPRALADAWRQLLDEADTLEEGFRARLRDRIAHHFDSKRLVARTEAALTKLTREQP